MMYVMVQKHYFEECGCMYTEGIPEPWHVCALHFSKKLTSQDIKKSNPITHKLNDFVLINPDTADTNIISKISIEDDEPTKRYWLYALKLQDDKYYVGMTGKSNPYHRIMAHGGYWGARWTMKHPPVKVLEVRDLGLTTKSLAEGMERNLTRAYMSTYGYQKVRGGSIIYAGRIIKIGTVFLRGNQLEQLFMALLLIIISLYFLSGV